MKKKILAPAELIGPTVREFQTQCLRESEACCIDLSTTELIDTAGAQLLVAARKSDWDVANISDRVWLTLEALGLSQALSGKLEEV